MGLKKDIKTQELSPQGYNLGKEPKNVNPFFDIYERGTSATIQVGTVTTETLEPGSDATASITNSGTATDAILDFSLGIPQGEPGRDGADGHDGRDGAKGDKGDTGAGVPIGGTAGQVLEKYGQGDYETYWADKNAVPVPRMQDVGRYLKALSVGGYDWAEAPGGGGGSTPYTLETLVYSVSNSKTDTCVITLKCKKFDDHVEVYDAEISTGYIETVDTISAGSMTLIGERDDTLSTAPMFDGDNSIVIPLYTRSFATSPARTDPIAELVCIRVYQGSNNQKIYLRNLSASASIGAYVKFYLGYTARGMRSVVSYNYTS